MPHPDRPLVDVPPDLMNFLLVGWADVTSDHTIDREPAAVYVKGDFTLYIDADNSVDVEGDHRPKYNLMFNMSDLYYADDLGDLFYHLDLWVN